MNRRRVLWVSLVKFPPLCNYLKESVPAHCGWLYSSVKALIAELPDIKMGVMIPSNHKSLEIYEVEDITYYLVPSSSINHTDKNQIKASREVIAHFNPNLIHIHGTEYSLAQAVCIANDKQVRVLANIQGLAGPYIRYADGGLSLSDKLLNLTPLDFYRGTFLLDIKRKFKHRAACENYVLTHITDIIGRTQWDHDHVLAINPQLQYHFMNETLRDSFYKEPVWTYESCRRHTIFVSNSAAPLKGAHQVLRALPLILREYPDTVVNFCGSSVMNNDIKTILHFQGYHLFLRRMVQKLQLQNHVRFLGTLSEDQMKQAFLDAHVYVMPSSIENSPNSLCEAQILGVPVVAAYCGGTPTLVQDEVTGYLYRYEEVEMLAQCIIRLFRSEDYSNISNNERNIAKIRHSVTKNAQRLKEIYTIVLNE